VVRKKPLVLRRQRAGNQIGGHFVQANRRGAGRIRQRQMLKRHPVLAVAHLVDGRRKLTDES
jgi:hypothetical protein